MLGMEIIMLLSSLCILGLTMGLALTTLSLFIWTEDATTFIIKARSDIRAMLQRKMFYQVMRSNIIQCFTYLMHFIAAESKEIYSTTLRFKIGGLASQLLYH